MIVQCFHNVCTALLAFAQRAPRRSAILCPCHTKRRRLRVCTAFYNHVSALWDRRGIRLKISNMSVISCTQRPHSVPSASTQRFHSVFTASMTFSQRASSCCSVFTERTRRADGAHTAFSRRAHSVLKAIIAFKMFYFFFSNLILQTKLSIFTFRSNSS